jgi:hypothetical protein
VTCQIHGYQLLVKLDKTVSVEQCPSYHPGKTKKEGDWKDTHVGPVLPERVP